MKIGIDASRYSHESATGVEWYSRHIIHGLIKADNGKDEIILYSKKPVKINGKNIINRILKADRLWTLKRLSKEMRGNPPDVLFVPSHTLPLSLPFRSVITIHDVAFRHLRKAYSFFQYRYLNWGTKFAVKNAQKIIVPSEATKKDLIHFYKCDDAKIMVVPHGFDCGEKSSREVEEVFKKSEVFKYFGIHKGMDYVLFVGRLESKKNLNRLIRAFKEFGETHNDFKLILAGKRGVGFQKILKTVNDMGIMHKVIMPGYITEAEKEALYKYCKIFAFPSLYEGFGLPILEAFYYKKPIIASQGSCIPEVGGDAVHYVDPYDEMDILAGLDKLTNNKEYVDELVEKGKERLKEFSWKKASEKTLKIIKG